MKSPFPGMDPYLERHWEDVHTRLIGYIADALQPQLSEDLVARMEEKVYVEDESGKQQLRKPDVRVVEFPTRWDPASGQASTAVLDEPISLEPVGDPIRQRSVLIYDSVGHKIVTAIGVLSPWNKSPGKAVNTYLEKRDKYINSEMNLVEIHLVRTGDWTDMIGPYVIPESAITTYRVTIAQPDLTRLLLYPISIRATLPMIKVPLRTQDPPAILNLQELVDKAYEMGRYSRVDYAKPCSPPFVGPEKKWADDLLREARKIPAPAE
jgi:hypothetical protein